MAIKRYKGQPLPITVQFSKNPFTAYNKDYSDIVEIFMNLKKDLENDLDDAYMQGSLTGTEVTYDSINHIFSLAMDYTNLTIGDSYYVVIAVDLGLGGDLVELQIDNESRRVLITSDENRL